MEACINNTTGLYYFSQTSLYYFSQANFNINKWHKIFCWMGRKLHSKNAYWKKVPAYNRISMKDTSFTCFILNQQTYNFWFLYLFHTWPTNYNFCKNTHEGYFPVVVLKFFWYYIEESNKFLGPNNWVHCQCCNTVSVDTGAWHHSLESTK